jgi:hypothetical protein
MTAVTNFVGSSRLPKRNINRPGEALALAHKQILPNKKTTICRSVKTFRPARQNSGGSLVWFGRIVR